MVRVSPGDQRFERGRKRVAELGQFVFDARRDLGGTRSPPSHAIRRRSTPRPAKKADAWNKDGLAELLRGHDAVVRALSALFVEGEFRLGKDALLTIDKAAASRLKIAPSRSSTRSKSRRIRASDLPSDIEIGFGRRRLRRARPVALARSVSTLFGVICVADQAANAGAGAAVCMDRVVTSINASA